MTETSDLSAVHIYRDRISALRMSNCCAPLSPSLITTASLRESSLSGVMRIGSPHDIADTTLPPILSHIARSSPKLRLEIDGG